MIQEFANVATRKFAKRLTADECQQFIDAALALQTSTGYGLYDCLILSSALQSGATVAFSDDLQHKQRIDGTLRIVNPFLNLAMQD